jgi:hypothetical protein
VNQEVTECSEVQQLRVEWYREHGKDYIRRCNCDTADGSNVITVNCVIVRASGINSLDPIRREFISRVTYPTRDNIYINNQN